MGEKGEGEGDGGSQEPTGLEQSHKNKSKQDFSYMRPNILALAKVEYSDLIS